MADKEKKGLYSHCHIQKLYWFFIKNKTHWFLLEKALANLASFGKSSESHPLVNTVLILGCVLPPAPLWVLTVLSA